MNTLESPITWMVRDAPVDEDAVEPCFGVGCLLRGRCWCYRAVESLPGGSTTRATCLRGGEFPKYLAIAPAR